MIWMHRTATQICQRCKLHFKINLQSCPHCTDLTERELMDFQYRRDEEMHAIAGLGRVFLVLALILLVATAALVSS